MIYLDSATNLQMDLGGAVATVEPECHVSYRDMTSVSTPEKGYKDTSGVTQRSVTSGTTDVVICASPQQGIVRSVESITFNNRDTAAVTVRIFSDDGTNERELFGPRSVGAGDIVFYEHLSGWGVI